MFRTQGSAYFRTNLKWLAHKIWCLKAILSWSLEHLLGVLLLCKISRNLVEFKAKRLAKLFFSKWESIFLRKVLILIKCLLGAYAD